MHIAEKLLNILQQQERPGISDISERLDFRKAFDYKKGLFTNFQHFTVDSADLAY